jgi:hypothetical protein
MNAPPFWGIGPGKQLGCVTTVHRLGWKRIPLKFKLQLFKRRKLKLELHKARFACLAFFAATSLSKHAVKHPPPTAPATQLAWIQQTLFRVAQVELHQDTDAVRASSAVANGINAVGVTDHDFER